MKPSRALVAVWLLILLYSAFFSAYSIQRHRAFLTNASDLGQIDQAVWNTLHGHFLEATRRDGQQLPRFTDHVEPIFAAASLTFLLCDSVESLLVLQSLMIALGALPVYWIARKRPRAAGAWGGWAVGFSALYLLFPALEAANLAEFHAVALAPPLLLFAYYYGAERRWRLYTLFALLALSTQEGISLLVFAMSAWFGISDFGFQTKVTAWVSDQGSCWDFKFTNKALGRKVDGTAKTPRAAQRTSQKLLNGTSWRRVNWVPLSLAVLAALWFVLTYFVIIPQNSPRGASPYTCRYVVTEDCREVVKGLFLNERLGYVGGLLASVGFIALLDPLPLLLGMPLLLANVVSNFPAQYSGAYHYSAPVAPYFVLAAIGGSARLIEWMDGRRKRKANGRKQIEAGARHSPDPMTPDKMERPPALANNDANGSPGILPAGDPRHAWVIAPVLFIALVYHLIAGYTPVGGAFAWPEVTAHNLLLDRFARQIPAEATLATTPALHPHLSHRRYLYRYPTTGDAEYVLIDVSESFTRNPIDFRVAYDDLLKGGYGVLDASDGYVLLRQGLPGKVNLPDEFFTLFRTRAAPSVPGQVDFGDAIRFLGYDVLNDPYGRLVVRLYWQRLRPLDQNYNLVPLILDESGAPRTDLDLTPTLLFWYPSAAWQANETVVAQTVPLDVGPRARLGVGVVLGSDWNDAADRLTPRIQSSAWKPRENNTWVELGAVEKRGKGYQASK